MGWAAFVSVGVDVNMRRVRGPAYPPRQSVTKGDRDVSLVLRRFLGRATERCLWSFRVFFGLAGLRDVSSKDPGGKVFGNIFSV